MTCVGERSRWRRLVVLLALSLLLGITTTWAVSLACGVYSVANQDGRSWSDLGHFQWSFDRESNREVQISCGIGVEYLTVTFTRWEDNEISADWLRSGGHVPKWSRTYESWRTGEPRPAGARELEPPCGDVEPDPDEPVQLTTTWEEACYLRKQA